MLHVISIDWLSLYCDFSEYQSRDDYNISIMPYSTRQFKVVEEVIKNKEAIATIQRVPVSSVIRENTGIIKFNNRILYRKNAIEYVKEFLRRFKIKVLNISRIDICADFNSFDRYENPHSFIIDFIVGDILKNGRCEFSLAGDHSSFNVYNYFRVGKKTSDVVVYMYNKSKEMKDVKFKHYIFEKWVKNGLYVTKDVWRLEVSISGRGREYIDKDTGEIKEIDLAAIYSPIGVSEIYHKFINHYFKFKYNNKTKNKSRMVDVDLFNVNASAILTTPLPKFKDTMRADKVLCKTLYQYERARREVTPEEREASYKLLEGLIADPVLRKYVKEKSEFWDVKKYS